LKKIFDEKIEVYNAESKKNVVLQQNNSELLEKISVLESAISKNKEEKEEQNTEREKLVKLSKSLQDDLNESESNCTKHLQKRQELEKRNIKLVKQVFDFE